VNESAANSKMRTGLPFAVSRSLSNYTYTTAIFCHFCALWKRKLYTRNARTTTTSKIGLTLD